MKIQTAIDVLLNGLIVLGAVILPRATDAAPHRYDHVVIVMEENRTVTQIIGDRVNAPFINSLADGGVRLGSMFAIEHPSQPNYLQLFSGSNQGVMDDNLPKNFSKTVTATFPFKTPNLGAEILAQGFTFAGYSEQLETAGTSDLADYDPHSATTPDVYYRRKHNPWANWVAKLSPTPTNQIPGTVNRPFTAFPTNFSLLPTVSFVIPNQLHDMHDGSRKEGDDWLRANLSNYAAWAKTNNSLLIVTWDEDDYNSINQIPTVFSGAFLRNGTAVGGTWTLHNLLRTLEDMYGSPTHAGSAAQVRSIVGPFSDDPVVSTVTFRQGLSGYTGVQDTQVSSETPSINYSTNQNLMAALDANASVAGNQESAILVRFDKIFGSAAGQLPPNAIIHSAKLILYTPANSTGADFSSQNSFRAHRMIADWNGNSTWNSLTNGVSVDDLEAASASTFSLVPELDAAPAIFDVSNDVELFKSGIVNNGWVIRASTTVPGDVWNVLSSETTSDQSLRPRLEVTFSIPLTAPYVTWAGSKNLNTQIDAPDADPDNDGVPNLGEFAYNLNPLVLDNAPLPANGTAGLPVGRYLQGVSGGILEVEFIRRTGATAAGLTYTVQFSSDLVHWSNGLAPAISSIGTDWQRVTQRDSVSGPNLHRFARIVVGLD
jgi:hypothetical protein